MPLRGPERHLEFDSPYEGEKLRHQTVLMDEIVLPWAESLDGGNPRILDLASGQGMEASKLAEQGLVVVASDISQVLTSKSFHNNIVRSNAEQIPFSDNSFSGVLLKDAWIFFSPDTKKRVLSEMHRVLKPGGSVLLVTELGDALRIRYIPNGSQMPQHETFYTNDGWRQEFEKLASKDNQIYGVEHMCTPNSTNELARQSGFDFELVREYRFNDPLAKESRWIDNSGFIVKLTAKK